MLAGLLKKLRYDIAQRVAEKMVLARVEELLASDIDLGEHLTQGDVSDQEARWIFTKFKEKLDAQ